MADQQDDAGAMAGSGTTAASLVAALCAFGLVVVFGRPLLSVQLIDGVSVHLLIMMALAAGAWLLTVVFMRRATRRGAGQP